MEATATKATFQKYSAYKDSGVEWLAEIPEHWQAIKMKYLFRDVSEKNKPEAELLSVTQDKGVVPRTWVESRMVMPSGNLESFKFIQKGDFAISLRSFEGGLEYCHHDGIISPAYTVLKKKKGLIDGYYKYLFKSKSFISEIQTSVVGIREGKNISYFELSYSLLPIPSPEEQTAIAKFLDDKTAKIDRAIAQKEKMIALLKERKQIIIQNAVTKGLNPNAKMKHSGVEWIGEIPEDWEVLNFRYLIDILTDYTANGSFGDLAKNVKYLDEPSYSRLVRLTDIRQDFENSGVYLNQQSHKYLGKSELFGGELLVANVGAYAGYSCIMPKLNIVSTLGPNMFLIKVKDSLIRTEFLNQLLNSDLYWKYIQLVAQSAAQPKLNKENIRQLKIILPSSQEQTAIVAHIETQSAKIDKAIKLQEQQIEKLKELKSTLIDSAVTGKLRLPSVQEIKVS